MGDVLSRCCCARVGLSEPPPALRVARRAASACPGWARSDAESPTTAGVTYIGGTGGGRALAFSDLLNGWPDAEGDRGRTCPPSHSPLICLRCNAPGP
jgi:hypothetical protein